MSETFLSTPDDIGWLIDTHLKDFPHYWDRIGSAILRGNEDAPDEVILYESQDPLSDDDPHLPLGEALGNPLIELYVQTPVFTVGEILITQNGREIAGKGRKPSKWDVEYESFDDLNDALVRALEIE